MTKMLNNQFVGDAVEIKSMLFGLPKIALSDAAVLIQGETGVGKELIADMIHGMSFRKGKPFVKMNLSEIPPTLFESELFGHKKGAFTDAVTDKKGLFETAQCGTVFLDEIDDFPMFLQSKILRVLEAKTIRRVGAENVTAVDVRVIASTKNNLRILIDEHKFREDLFHRINTISIVIPSLRERKEDIPLLIDHFVHLYRPDNGLIFTDEAKKAFLNYKWSGNVRELQHVVERLSVLMEGEIKLTDLPAEIKNYNLGTDFARTCALCFHRDLLKLEDIMKCVEQNIILDVMKSMNGSLTKSAHRLGIGVSTLHDKLKKYSFVHLKE